MVASVLSAVASVISATRTPAASQNESSFLSGGWAIVFALIVAWQIFRFFAILRRDNYASHN